MNKKTIISLSVTAALIGATVWYLRQLSVAIRQVTEDASVDDGLDLPADFDIEDFLSSRMRTSPAEAKRLMDESREIVAEVDAQIQNESRG